MLLSFSLQFRTFTLTHSLLSRRFLHAQLEYNPLTQLPATFVLHDLPSNLITSSESLKSSTSFDPTLTNPTQPTLSTPARSVSSKSSPSSSPSFASFAWTISPHLPIHILLTKLETLFHSKDQTCSLHTIHSNSNSNSNSSLSSKFFFQPKYIQQKEDIRWCRSVNLVDIVKYTLLNQGELLCRTTSSFPGSSTSSSSFVIHLPSLKDRSKPIEASLETLQKEFNQLDLIKHQCDLKSEKSANRLIWGGLLGLCAQWGMMARLTWWEYSWDVMEPISYFITFGTAIVGYMFYILTKREYTYETMTGLHLNRKQTKLYEQVKLDLNRYLDVKQQIVHQQQLFKQIQLEYPSTESILTNLPTTTHHTNTNINTLKK